MPAHRGGVLQIVEKIRGVKTQTGVAQIRRFVVDVACNRNAGMAIGAGQISQQLFGSQWNCRLSETFIYKAQAG
jgi:hypothetical protein